MSQMSHGIRSGEESLKGGANCNVGGGAPRNRWVVIRDGENKFAWMTCKRCARKIRKAAGRKYCVPCGKLFF
jgi:hypothetical protein